MATTSVSALLVDDEAIVRESLSELLNETGWVEVEGTADSAAQAHDALAAAVPDIVVTDLVLGGGPDGIQLTKAIKAKHPHLPVLLLSGFDEALFAEQALEAGASGFVMKTSPVPQLLTAIQTAVRGGIWVSDAVREQLTGVSATSETLREALGQRLFDQLRQGNRSVMGLANALDLSMHDVESTIDRACLKVGVPSRAALFLLLNA